MAFRYSQHVLRAKSIAENFGLFALYTAFFICCWLPHGQLLAIIEETVSFTEC